MPTPQNATRVQQLCTRITCDYLDTPGLTLTLPQATELWDIDAESCTRALQRLVAAGFLRSTGGMYRRAKKNPAREQHFSEHVSPPHMW
jgi:hypothetical protein